MPLGRGFLSSPRRWTYGHHHKFGEMALARLFEGLKQIPMYASPDIGTFLEDHPAKFECIIENSSWSCVHGIERWRSDCGCNAGESPAGTNGGPLKAFDKLAESGRSIFTPGSFRPISIHGNSGTFR